MSRKTDADLYAEEMDDSALRRLARQVVKQRAIIKDLRKQRRHWLYGSSATDTQSNFQRTRKQLGMK